MWIGEPSERKYLRMKACSLKLLGRNIAKTISRLSDLSEEVSVMSEENLRMKTCSLKLLGRNINKTISRLSDLSEEVSVMSEEIITYLNETEI